MSNKTQSLRPSLIAGSELQVLRDSVLLRTALKALSFAVPIWLLLFWLPVMFHRTDDQRDMVVYWRAAYAIDHKLPIYTEVANAGPDHTPGNYTYLPQFAALLRPLGLISWHAFTQITYVALLASLFLFAYCLARLIWSKPTLVNFCTVVTVVLGLPDVLRFLIYGQAEVLMWTLCGLAACFPKTRGVMLAAAVQIKPYVLFGLLIVLWRSDNRQRLGAVLMLFAGLALGTIVCGPQSFVSWYRYVLPILGQGTFNVDNFSLSFLGLRILHGLGWAYHSGPLPTWARLYLVLMSVAAPVITALLTQRKSEAVQWSTTVAASVLFTPMCWSGYLTQLTIPILLWVRVNQRRAR